MEPTGPAEILVLSAANRVDLERHAGAVARRIRELIARRGDPRDVLADAAYTLQTGRSPKAARMAVVTDDAETALDALDAFAAANGDVAAANCAIAVGNPADRPPCPPGPADGPAAALRAWLSGTDVDWAGLWSERRRRVSLPVPSAGEAAPAAIPPENAEGRPDPAAAVRFFVDYLVRQYSQYSGIAPNRFDATMPLDQIGLSSYLVTRLNAQLEADFGERDRTLFFSHPNLQAIAETLAGRHAGAARSEHAGAAQSEHAGAARSEPASSAATEAPVADAAASAPIAIVGMAGRFPGAETVRQFWRNLRAGRDCVGRIPPDRAAPGWPVDWMWGGFLDNIADFDPLLFSISPRDAELMDPQERLFLEVVWECLENAGYSRSRLREQTAGEVGVFAGAMHNEYPYFGVQHSLTGEPLDTGATLAGIANRVSYFLDLHGPSLSVDTMCSSSLTAIHLAMHSLRRGEARMAVVGATNLSLHPNKFVQQQRMELAATDHRCRSFGAGGDGFVPAEAVAALLLKPLDAALADGDRVHAVLRGSATVHAGRTNGYLVPNPTAQAAMVAKAWADSGVDPASVGYLEAHGAGTALGDPVELAGLSQAFADAGLAPGSVAIGAVKSCIGHAESAAGLAGLIKVVLQMQHGEYAASLHAETLNPDVDWARLPFRVQATAAAWPSPDGQPRRAGVSSFGAGGAIAHVVLEQAPEPAAATSEQSGRPQVIVLSGRDQAALRRVARRLADGLRAEPELDPADVAYTLQVGREPLRERLALVAGSTAEMVDALDRFLAGDTDAVLLGTAPARGEAPRRAWAPDTDPEELARAWVGGARLDWLADGSRPANRIVELPSYPFERVRCWPAQLDAPSPTPLAAEQTPVAAEQTPVPAETSHARQGHASDVPLYERAWLPDEGALPRPSHPCGERIVCVFSRQSEPVARAIQAARGDAVVLVREGERADGIDGFFTTEDAVRLADELAEPAPITGWLDLADLHRPAAETGLWQARLAMLQRLVDRHGSRLRVLQVAVAATGRAKARVGGPAGALVAGIVRALAAEGSVGSARSLELETAADDPGQDAAEILAEFAADSPYAEVSRRAGVRLRPALIPMAASAAGFTAKPAACYLVTGGTRGLGLRVARWLADRGARRIAVLGRGELDADRSAALDALRADGVTVLVHLGPIEDRVAVGGFLDKVRSELGPIDGLVHCAGRAGAPARFATDGYLDDQSEVFAAKVDGFEVLCELTAEDQPSFAVLFSSICAVAPGVARGVAGYAAANGYLDAAAAHGARIGSCPVQSIAWPQWHESGGGVGRANPAGHLGVGTLSDAQALRVLEQVIGNPSWARIVPLPAADAPVDPDRLLLVPNLADAEAAERQPAAVPEPAAIRESTAGSEPVAGHELAAERQPATVYEPVAAPVATDIPAAEVGVPDWLVAIFAETLHLPAGQLDHDADFNDLGIDSIVLAELLRSIERRLDRSLDPGLLLDYPTLTELAEALQLKPEPQPTAGPEPIQTAEPEPIRTAEPERARTSEPAPVPVAESQEQRMPAAGPSTSGRIAIIGAACRFPGAPDLDTFWANLLDGVNAVREVPTSRWDARSLYRPNRELGYSISKWGGFVDGIEEFDPDAFGMTEDEGRALDPAIRMTLETAHNCLADAGYQLSEVAGQQVGVFVGARMSHYGERVGVHAGGLRSDQNFITAYLAQVYDLRGPNMVVDSACSSSLVSLQLAVRSLRDGECALAIAGGVEVLLDERDYLDLSASGALSPSGRCSTFDESADGFVPGEGCGLVLLKPLEAALADGDRIHAVLDAVAVNNDGRTMGVTTPNHTAQQRVVRAALAAAGREPRQVGMIEAHGTGTVIGDPIELRALTAVFTEDSGSPARSWCPVGSVKSNIGHLLSAAGIAGVLKAMLAIEHGVVPATLWCERPNPRYDFSGSPFFPNTSRRSWDSAPGDRVAGVSSFGLGGTNAHAVLSGLDPASRPVPVARAPLPAPTWRRRRLWFDAPVGAAPNEPAGPEALVSSLLDLELTGVYR